MKLFLSLVFVLIAFSSSFGESLYDMILKGDIEKAKDSLSKLSTATHRNGDFLFYTALLESEADKSGQLLKAALNSSVSPIYKEDIYLKLAQYYFIKNNLPKLKKTVTEYLAYWEDGKYRSDFLRYSIYLSESERKYDNAIRLLDRYLLQYQSGDPHQKGLIDKTRVMVAFKKDIAARKLLRSIARDKKGFAVPLSLYTLTLQAIRKNQTDDAIFFYNVFREKYPMAVGLESALSRLENMSADSDTDSRAEELTGTYYTIQVGVFSDKNNASNLKKEFKKEGKPVELTRKKVGSREYYAVYVGRFQNYLDANNYKEILESAHKEVFQIVTR